MSAQSITKNGHVPGKHDRQDRWWVEPLIAGITLVAFAVYSIVVAAQQRNYEYFGSNGAHYVSPLFSVPWFGIDAATLAEKLPFSPAFLWLWIPVGFRATCYYFRRVYYRAFFASPSGCSVPEMKRAYKGERVFPLSVNNLHRYFWYLSVFVLFFHWIEVVRSFNFGGSFGIGIGSLLIATDVALLSYYIFSCHAWRHIAGGCINCFSKSKARHTLWQRISKLNESHGFWGWASLMSIWLTDIYIRACASGAISDFRLF
jgi:hypothetical protein